MSGELTKEELRAFKLHVAGLNKLIEKVRRRHPEAQYYLVLHKAPPCVPKGVA